MIKLWARVTAALSLLLVVTVAVIRILAPILIQREPFALWLDDFELDTSTLMIVDPYAHRMMPIGTSEEVTQLAISPNNRYIAYIQLRDPVYGYTALFIFDQVTRANLFIQYHVAILEPLRWSADSEQLVYLADTQSAPQLFDFHLGTRVIEPATSMDLDITSANELGNPILSDLLNAGFSEISNLLQVNQNEAFFGAGLLDLSTLERRYYLFSINRATREFNGIALSGLPRRLFPLPDW